MKVEAPPQHIVDMTKEVLAQNREILEMNATLLKYLATPPVVVHRGARKIFGPGGAAWEEDG